MASFIDFEAQQVDDQNEVIMVSDDEVEQCEEVCDNFIDDSAAAAVDADDASFYRAVDNQQQQEQQLENVGNIDEILEKELKQSYVDAESLDIQNLCHSDEEIEPEVDFSAAKKRIKAFQETFFPLNQTLTLKEAILYAIRYQKTKKTDETTEDFDAEISSKLADDLRIELDLKRFTEMCYTLTKMLMENNYFLRIYELRGKFREIRLKTEKKILRELSSCIKIKFDGFEIISIQCRRELR